MKFHVLFLFTVAVLLSGLTTISAQVGNLSQSQIEAAVGQITNASVEVAALSISGDGRFVVMESTANLATENPRNADGNREIFLFDYAQRRIFQITNTLSLRNDTNAAYSASNTRVLITNVRPVISNDGRWLAFGSNATTATPAVSNTTTPGNFNAESFGTSTTPNPLLADGNTEMWLYQIPATAPVNLSAGDELPVTDLTGGTFIRATNTAPSRLPVAGSSTALPLIGDDNRDATISDDGNFIAFTSNRDLVIGGNAGNDANNEIYTYFRSGNQLNQITTTPRGTAFNAILNLTPTLSGNGLRVAFQSNADKPITGIAESNTERNFEVFVADLTPNGAIPPLGAFRKQITVTAPTNAGDIVNILDFGKRMSRDGRYVALDSYADLQGENGGANYTTFALYLYDIQAAIAVPSANAFRRIGPRSDADATIAGNEVPHFGGFTDNSASGAPSTLVFETRQNIVAAGTVAATEADGLNPGSTRPPQIYGYPLNVAAASATFKRLTRFPALTTFVPSIQPIPSDSVSRMTFNLGATELGTGNSDLSNEAYYFLLPIPQAESTTPFNIFTGASRQLVAPSPVPTPSASPSPTPVTPSAVQGVSPGMLATVEFNPGINTPVTARAAVGSLSRRFTLPIELSGVSMTINGAAVGLRSVNQQRVSFVVPPGLTAAATGTAYPFVINSNGTVFRGSVTIVPARPDIFRLDNVPAPNGRARLFNITNPVFRTEPFNVTTLRFRGGRRVPTVLRLFLTGVEGVPATAGVTAIRIRDVTITPNSAAVLREPGIYSFDFTLPASLQDAGDVPIVVTITAGGATFQSRLDDTAARVFIL